MQISKLLPRMLVLALLLTPLAAKAQIAGLYADFSTTSLSSSGSPRFNGGTLGFYDEVALKHSFSGLRIGGDARFSVEHASQYGVSLGYDTFVLGPEVSLKTDITRLRPYAEVLFGGARASAYYSGGFQGYIPGTNDFLSKNYGLIAFAGGADVNLVPHLAWRAVEAEYGKFNGISSVTISSGIVLRLQ